MADSAHAPGLSAAASVAPGVEAAELAEVDGALGDWTAQAVARYQAVRDHTVALAAPLSPEDCAAQSMPDASPAKWHLAHTTWFFETFLLEPLERDFAPFAPAFRVLFNSYYNGVGAKHPRAQRGLLTRPPLSEVLAYRAAVDARMHRLMPQLSGMAALRTLLELGLQHEQQHQELLLTDIQHLLWCNPMGPVYGAETAQHLAAQAGMVWFSAAAVTANAANEGDTGGGAALAAVVSPWEVNRLAMPPAEPAWHTLDGGVCEIGHPGTGFAFDNELPRHRMYLQPYQLASRLVSRAEFAAFVEVGGYAEPAHWLAEGWDWRVAQGLEHPLYWRRTPGGWDVFTLQGWQPLLGQGPHRRGAVGQQRADAAQAATHLSYYEADAYARWAGARLPTEGEWEHAAQTPVPGGWHGLFGSAWQWTQSSYAAYPGFRVAPGAVGEYNGKFMVNQYVLRGSSSATPPGHARATYRNFFPATARWQVTGLRLARDVGTLLKY